MANHDALTGLPNRALLKDRLRRRCCMRTLRPVGDGGVHRSRQFQSGQRQPRPQRRRRSAEGGRKRGWSRCVRATDTVVRLGGDEFVVLLLDQPKSAEAISATLKKLRAAIAEPIEIEGHALARDQQHGRRELSQRRRRRRALLANADAAMYRAKEIGRDNFQFYTPELNIEGPREVLAARRTAQALSLVGEFVLHYQPQVDLRTGRRVRGRSAYPLEPSKAGLDPAAQVHPAGRGDRPDRADRRLGAARGLPSKQGMAGAGLPPITVCVNVSARQFGQELRRRRRRARCEKAGWRPKYLELEITESLIMRGRRPAARHDGGIAAPGRATCDRRLRHRLFQPQRPEDVPGRHG